MDSEADTGGNLMLKKLNTQERSLINAANKALIHIQGVETITEEYKVGASTWQIIYISDHVRGLYIL